MMIEIDFDQFNALIADVKRVADALESIDRRFAGTTLYVDKDHSYLQAEVRVRQS